MERAFSALASSVRLPSPLGWAGMMGAVGAFSKYFVEMSKTAVGTKWPTKRWREIGSIPWFWVKPELCLNPVDLQASPRRPFTVLPLGLAVGAGKDERLSVRREPGVGDALLGVHRMHE